MNLSPSRCGSGCESGWTFYLDRSSCSRSWSTFEVEYEEEGLSMVSDASSGPRHYYCQDYAECVDENGKNSRNKRKIKENCGNEQHSCLDDTASSPVIGFSEKNFKKEGSVELSGFSQGFSGTHFKGKSAFQKKLGFLKSGKTSSKHADGFQERSRE
ncbi:uncharacterized protein LOC120155984 isoform X2 [Hibiscus syriacus]|uniref:uncharacterized protein LOC120155984 isoform X2 n=1 Tax=Hibiscus syriacus TaxID=106335 RepID=UPI001923D99B|nr:uncharacterized protein LOC120155984 isoform X2 [Hibiscus syriacus]